MIDREYVKLNTSIQTGSNAQTLRYDDDGNVEATIELRLPDNVFGGSPSTKKIEKVVMQTSKMRLSMEQTPIAELPLDQDLTTEDLVASTCKLDVYPFCLLDNGEIKPEPGSQQTNVFPNYKNHIVKFTIRWLKRAVPGEEDPTILDVINARANTEGYGFPKTSRYYDVLKGTDALNADNHLLNLCAKSNHEPYHIEGNALFVKHIGTLEQMLQDAIENAITYALTSDYQEVTIDFISADYVDENPDQIEFDPPINKDLVLTLEEYGERVYYWRWDYDDNNANTSCGLNFACKPTVKLNEQSLTIAYDSAAFQQLIPIIWNTPYVETYDYPEQMNIDTLRNSVWFQPPPKRQYKYGAVVNENGTYQFAVQNVINSAAMNIIANKAMRDTFSFLPWIRVDTDSLSIFEGGRHFRVTKTKEINETGTKRVTRTFQRRDGTPASYWMISHVISDNTPTYRYGVCYRFSVFDEDGGENAPADKRFYQEVEVTNHARQEELGNVPVNDFDVPVTTTINTILPPVHDISTFESYTSYDTTLEPGETIINQSTNNTSCSKTEDVEIVPGKIVAAPWAYCHDVDGTPTWVLGITNNGGWGGRRNQTRNWCKWIPPYEKIRSVEIDKDEGEDISQFPIINKPHRRYEWRYEISFSGEDEHGANSASLYWEDQANDDAIIQENITDFKESDITFRKIVEEIDQGVPYSKRDLVLPNIELSDKNEFYILDGTTAVVDIGAQEIIRGTTNGNHRFHVSDYITYDTWYKYKKEIYYCSTQDANNMPADLTLNIAYASNDAFPLPYQYPDELPDQIQHSWIDYLICEFDFLGFYDPNQISVRELLQYATQIKVHPLTKHAEEETTIAPILKPRETDATQPWELWQEVLPRPPAVTNEYDSDDPSLTPGTTQNVETDWRETGPYYESTIPAEDTLTFFKLEKDPTRWVQGIYVGNSLNGGVIPMYPRFANDGDTIEPDFIAVHGSGIGSHIGLFWRLYTTPLEPTPAKNLMTYKNPVNEVTVATRIEEEETQTLKTVTEGDPSYEGNVRLSFTWNNLPMVVMSPIASIVLTLNGMTINPEIQPINITDHTGSSLTSTIPVIENYFSMAQSLRDLHDELVVAKDTFEDTATYTVTSTSGTERAVTISAKYITKDGSLHQIYIPPKGVFSLQLTFGLSFYIA